MKIACTLAILVILSSQGVNADDDREDDHDQVRRALEAGQIVPLKDILARTASAYPGEMIEVELEHDDGRMIYEIKVLTADGRVRKLSYDARDGELLEAKGRAGRR